MDAALLALGLAKLSFALAVAAGTLAVAYQGLGRLLAGSASGAPPSTAVAVLEAAGLLALGLLVRNAVGATFDAIDLTARTGGLSFGAVGRLVLHAVVHLGLGLALGTGVLALGVSLFNRLTPEVDELEEVRRGHLPSAIVLGAILVVIALVIAPGLEALLEGLIPFPKLPAGMMPRLS